MAKEQSTIYIVQSWIERYEYWADVVEPAKNMFDVPTAGYGTEEQARERLRVLRETYPEAGPDQYRVIRRVMTEEVI